jgi:hypothetical protein
LRAGASGIQAKLLELDATFPQLDAALLNSTQTHLNSTRNRLNSTQIRAEAPEVDLESRQLDPTPERWIRFRALGRAIGVGPFVSSREMRNEVVTPTARGVAIWSHLRSSLDGRGFGRTRRIRPRKSPRNGRCRLPFGACPQNVPTAHSWVGSV